ncbi:tetratricopeptide repeat protein [Actinomadura coerulea]|uniref:tetratricopeptide repeat protein n=1 Tax=Actinomadura coerulea TaxID=46159 RepID=UPI0034328D27
MPDDLDLAGTWRLTIGENAVSLHAEIRGADDADVTRAPGVNDAFALREMYRAVGRLHQAVRTGRAGQNRKASIAEMDRLLRRLGRALADVLGTDVASRLAAEAAGARRSGRRLRLGLDIEAGALTALPWEALLLPGEDLPLAIHEAVIPFRVSGPDATATAFDVPGGPDSPLRVVALLASPQSLAADAPAEPLLDLEREAQRLATAASAAGGSLDLRVLSSGTPEALPEVLAAAPADVVHIVCHAEPGRLVLEDANGGRRPAGVGDLVAAWRQAPPAAVVLAGCSTAAPVTSARDDDGGTRYLSGLAQSLTEQAPAEQGAPIVVAMTAPVSDEYAGDLMAAVYSRPAAHGDLAAALHTARTELEKSRRRSADRLPEWHVPVLYAGSNTARAAEIGAAAPMAVPVADVPLALPPGRFVGRRSLLRAAVRDLDAHAGLVVHGVGGGGKSAFLGEVLRLRSGRGTTVPLSGPVDPGRILDEVAGALRGAAPEALADPDRDWRDRLAALIETAAHRPEVALTLVLDDFEVNLRYDDQGRTAFADREVGAFVTRWVEEVQHAALLATSRHPLPAEHPGSDRLAQLPLPPLSTAETGLLRLRLPAVRRLPPPYWQELRTVIGGHPRTYGYLDALLSVAGNHVAGDIAERIDRLVDGGLEAARARTGGIVRAAVVEAVALTVRDTLLTELLAVLDEPARSLLRTAAVFRLPAPAAVFVPDGTDPASIREPLRRLERLGLISSVRADDGEEVWVVHRWTAAELAKLEPDGARAGHGRAAAYWRARFASAALPQGRRITAAMEAIHHHVEAGSPGDAASQANKLCGILHAAGHWSTERALCERMFAWVAAGSEQEAQIHRQLGLIARDRGHAAEALVHMERALAVSVGSGDRLGIAFAAHQLGSVHHNLGGFGEAEARYRQAAETFAELGRERDSAATAFEISLLDEDRGRLDSARAGLRTAMETFERAGDREALTSCHRRMADLAERAGDIPVAMGHCRDALALCGETGDRAAATSVKNQLGTLHILAGDHEAAYREFDEALQMAVERGMPEETARSRQHLGVCALHRDAPEIAEEHVRAALELNTELGRVTGQAGCWTLLASIAEKQGRPLLGLARARRALPLFRRTEEKRDRANTYRTIGDCLCRLGRYAAAGAFYRKGLADAVNAQDAVVEARIRRSIETLPAE